MTTLASPALPTPVTLAEVAAKPVRLVAGLMTGTSMDGLDIALCRIAAGVPRRVELVASASEPFPDDLRRALLPQGALTVAEGARLSRRLGLWYAEATARLVEAHGLRPDLVGLHGQTVYHEHGVTTVQLGEPSFLALRLGCPVVSDFRTADIAAGGCGAPLVPVVDKWLLGRSDEGVVALNLGGIANLTAIPPLRTGEEKVVGFDCGPANMVLDELARRMSGGVLSADLDGRLAAHGQVRAGWLAPLVAHPFFAETPPRSAGREQFGTGFVDELLALARPASEAEWHDLFATTAELTVHGVVASIREHVPAGFAIRRLVASGGGARNPYLLRRLAEALAPIRVETTDAHGLPVDLKEAIAFACLASARIDRIPANLPEVTGAANPVLLGKITEVVA